MIDSIYFRNIWGDDINIPRGYLQQTAKLNAETTCMLLKTDSSKASITAKDLAGLQLFQTSSKILDTIRVAVSKNPAAILAAMCELLQEKGKAAHYLRAAEYALAHRDVIDKSALSELNRLAAAAKADKANVELRELKITGRQRMTRTINHARGVRRQGKPGGQARGAGKRADGKEHIPPDRRCAGGQQHGLPDLADELQE